MDHLSIMVLVVILFLSSIFNREWCSAYFCMYFWVNKMLSILIKSFGTGLFSHKICMHPELMDLWTWVYPPVHSTFTLRKQIPSIWVTLSTFCPFNFSHFGSMQRVSTIIFICTPLLTKEVD